MDKLQLPSALQIPVTTAATLKLFGSLSARDISYAMAVWYFAQQFGLTEHYTVKIPDNPLRAAIGQTRRGTIAEEEGRFDRLGASTAIAAGMDEPGHLPTMYMRDMGRYKTMDGDYVWEVDPGPLDAFTPEYGEKIVAYPTHLLRNASSRHASILMMRVLAWWAGYNRRELEYERQAEFLTIRITPDELRQSFDVDAKTPSNLMRDVIEPALLDINEFSNFYVEAHPLRTRYRGGKRGKVTAIEFMIAPTEQPVTADDFLARARARADEIRSDLDRTVDTAATRIILHELNPRKGWKRPSFSRGKPTPPPAPASIENVVSLPVDKTFDKFAQDPPSRARGFVMPPKHTRLSGDGD